MKRTNHLITCLLLVPLFLVVANSCKKDDEGGSGNSFTDSRDGNVYKTVTIGNQVWMAENLKYLPSVVGPDTDSRTSPYYYVYDYDGTDVNDAKAADNYRIYGVLYNWPAAMAGSTSSSTNPSGVKGVCPTGWHLPSDSEWTELIDYLGGEDVAGGKLKEAGTTHWDRPNTGATNESGFKGFAGGRRDVFEIFLYFGNSGWWWSATGGTFQAYYKCLVTNTIKVYGEMGLKDHGMSVRCVKD